MGFDPSIEIIEISPNAKVMRVNAQDVTRDQGNDAMWYSPKASVITSTPVRLSNPDREIVLWQRGNYIKTRFTADNSAADGQGFCVTTFKTSWIVESVQGDVFIVPASGITLADRKTDMYNSQSRRAASIGDLLSDGDAILCSHVSSFVLKVTTPDDNLVCYDGLPLVSLALYED